MHINWFWSQCGTVASRFPVVGLVSAVRRRRIATRGTEALDMNGVLGTNKQAIVYIEMEPALEMCAGQNLQERERKEMRSRLKKTFLVPVFFRFFSFLERVFPLFPIFHGISHPVLRRSFPVFSSLHLSKPVPGFLMGLKVAILERVLNETLCKPVPRRSSNRSSPFLKSFLVFP